MTNDIVLPPVLYVKKNTNFATITKVLSWLCAVLLSLALVISLVSVTSERDEFRDQLGKQSQELICRTVATVITTKAIASRDNTLAEALIAATRGEDLTALIVTLARETEAVDTAIRSEEIAIKKCASI